MSELRHDFDRLKSLILRELVQGEIFSGSSVPSGYQPNDFPTGTMTAANKVFRLLHAPIIDPVDTLCLWSRGLRLKRGVDFTGNGRLIKFTTAPGSVFTTGSMIADYYWDTRNPEVSWTFEAMEVGSEDTRQPWSFVPPPQPADPGRPWIGH